MIRRTTAPARRRPSSLAALPLALQIAAEARQAAAPAAPAAQSADILRNQRAPGARRQLLRLPWRREDGRPAPRLARGPAQGRQIRTGDRAGRSREEPADPGGAADASTLKMPKGGRLTPAEIDALAEWVKAGAVWPAVRGPSRRLTAPPAGASAAKPAPSLPAYVITPEQRAFWSFQPIRVAPVPAVSHASWPKTDIDRYVLARLEQAGLAPVRAADKRTLIRRATLDLIGLPPTADEIEAFEKDASPDAFAKVVDRLLASPQYGETWGRLWLDVARYGEDDYRSLDPKQRGYNPYPERVSLSRLGDQGVQRRSAVRPVRARAAGRRSARRRVDARAHACPRSAFSASDPWFYDNGAVEITRADERHDRVDVVSRGFLGLTVGCARCHDHKYDPIPDPGLLLAGRRVPEHARTTNIRWSPRASSTSTRAGQADREEGEAARGVHARRSRRSSARRWRCRRRNTWRRRGRCSANRRKRSPRSSTPRSWITSCSIAG